MRYLRPAEYRESIFEIDLQSLHDRGIRAVMLDLDNTMVEWNNPEPTEALLGWLDRVQSLGMKACIVSNNTGSRVRTFAAKVGVPFISKAVKPSRRGFREAMALLGVRPEETAVVGDQIFTDILGGNRSGAYTILVVPIHRQEFIGTKVLRVFERLVLRYLDRRGLLRQP